MKELQKVNDIFEAEELLKNKVVLISYSNVGKNYYFCKGDKVMIKNNSYSYVVSYKEFKELYKHEKFYIYENDEEEIDLKKDEEYYSWNHK